MLRTTVGVSILALLGAAGACSSKSTSDDKGTGGNGSILGGSSTGGIASGTAGTRTNGGVGTGGTGTGGGTGLCPGAILTCLDEDMATFCNSTTGIEETFSCKADAAEIGFVSSGCTMGTALTEDECALDSVADAKCLAGAQGYAFCGGFTTDEDLFNIYVNCFQDYMGAHAIVPCFADYVSETMTTDADCQAAVDNCFPGAGGAGSGGAGPDGSNAGAGGAQ